MKYMHTCIIIRLSKGGECHMSKRKKKGGEVQPDKLITLATATLNLITALILLLEKLKS